MTWNPGLTKLQELLADLYSTEEDARRVADQAGLAEKHIAFKDKAVITWYNVLKEAHRRKRVEAVVAVARREYEEKSEELTQAEQEYLAWLGQTPQPGEVTAPGGPVPGAAPKFDIQMPGATGVVVSDGGMVVQQVSGAGQAPDDRTPPVPDPDTTAGAPPIAVIRELLLAAFTAEDLPRLFRYTSNEELRPLVRRFSLHAGLDDMVDETIEYCQTKLLLPDLLKEVQEANPRQYARFESRLRGEAASTATATGPFDVKQRTEFSYLSGETINRLLEAVVDTQMAAETTRRDLLAGIDPGYVSLLPSRDNPLDQIRSDLLQMNRVPYLLPRQVPLRIWLTNAVNRLRLSHLPEQTLFQSALAEVETKMQELLP